jgi:hypothetical protein
MKRLQFAVYGLSIGAAIYGAGAVIAVFRLVNSGWSRGALAALAWPLIVSILFGLAALAVHQRTSGR